MSDITYKMVDNHLTIRFVDDMFNTSIATITPEYHYVRNYLNGNVKKFYEMLISNREHIDIIEESNGMTFRIRMQYLSLDIPMKTKSIGSEGNNEMMVKIMNRFSQMDTLINDVSSKLTHTTDRLIEVERQLSYGIILPGYKAVIPKEQTWLGLNYVPYLHRGDCNYPEDFCENQPTFFKSKYHGHYHGISNSNHSVNLGCKINPYYFSGYTIEPLSHLKELEKLYIRHMEDNITNLDVIEKLTSLKWLHIIGFNQTNINLTQLKNLKIIKFANMPELEIVNVDGLDLEEFHIHNCPKLVNMPSFNTKVKVVKE